MSFIGYTRRGIVPYIAQKWDRDWRMVILHHTWKPTVKDFEEKPDGVYWMKVIDRYHRMKGWRKIGYHFVVMPDGLIYVGRTLNETGAHTVGKNDTAIGVCLLGNFDEEEMPSEQYVTMKYLVCWLLNRFGLTPNDLFFHRDFAQKTCPGLKLQKSEIRKVIQLNTFEATKRFIEILLEVHGKNEKS